MSERKREVVWALSVLRQEQKRLGVGNVELAKEYGGAWTEKDGAWVFRM